MTYRELWQGLLPLYDVREAQAVARWLLEVAFGLSQTDVACGAVEKLQGAELAQLHAMLLRLQQGKPVQYVVGRAFFGPREFAVGPGVLIPRPETYELCQWIAAEAQPGANVLDIGTGSGCIACTLAADIKGARVTAWDISEQALVIAQKNAKTIGSIVRFEQQDALSPPADTACWDVVVSNPPYICEREKRAMERHVLDHEPATALFVPDDDPLRFYRAITQYAVRALRPGGRLFFELNAAYATDTQRLVEQMGLAETELRDDQFGRTRFLKATKQS